MNWSHASIKALVVIGAIMVCGSLGGMVLASYMIHHFGTELIYSQGLSLAMRATIWGVISARGKSHHGIRPSLHPGGRRCDSGTYSRYAPESRLVRRAQERSRCSRDFHHGLIWLVDTYHLSIVPKGAVCSRSRDCERISGKSPNPA